MHKTRLTISVAALVLVIPTCGLDNTFAQSSVSSGYDGCSPLRLYPHPTHALNLENYTWISVTSLDYMLKRLVELGENTSGINPLPSYPCLELSKENLTRFDFIQSAINGSDSCKRGLETCGLSSGFSSPGDDRLYSESISKTEALDVETHFPLDNGSSVLNIDGKYYLFELHSSDSEQPVQARFEFANTTLFSYRNTGPIHLTEGQSITLPFTIRTFATYGRPTNVSVYTTANAPDSGIDFKILPSDHFLIPERSTANGTVLVTATKNANDGIYGLFIGGYDNAHSWVRSCGDYTGYVCPGIQIGNSSWEIRMFSGFAGMGGDKSPDVLDLKTVIEKPVYNIGETIGIRLLVQNNGNDSVVLQNPRMIIEIGNATVLHNSLESTTELHNLVNIDVMSLPDYRIKVPAHSSILLARPFYWNQELASDINQFYPDIVRPKVSAGNYTIETSAGFNGTVMDSKTPLTISPVSDSESATLHVSRCGMLSSRFARLDDVSFSSFNATVGQIINETGTVQSLAKGQMSVKVIEPPIDVEKVRKQNPGKELDCIDITPKMLSQIQANTTDWQVTNTSFSGGAKNQTTISDGGNSTLSIKMQPLRPGNYTLLPGIQYSVSLPNGSTVAQIRTQGPYVFNVGLTADQLQICDIQGVKQSDCTSDRIYGSIMPLVRPEVWSRSPSAFVPYIGIGAALASLIAYWQLRKRK
ncbi:MAG: hypothetical protein ABI361_08735 [Nitrososphaera sp.]